MNMYDLRNVMKVQYYEKYPTGCAICYYRNNNHNVITLTNDETLKELIAIGSIEEGDNYDAYILSQWDALNIAIRFELSKETEKELNESDLFEAIAKITKPNK